MSRLSAWSKGVKLYAHEFQKYLTENNLPATKDNMLNGAKNWANYSEGGCALICDFEIASRLCTPSELVKCKGGQRGPNSRETWLECQARALNQAHIKVIHLAAKDGQST